MVASNELKDGTKTILMAIKNNIEACKNYQSLRFGDKICFTSCS